MFTLPNVEVDADKVQESGLLKDTVLVMAEHEDRVVIGRVRAPPAFPVLVGPGAALRAEHIAAHDSGADIVERMDQEFVQHSARQLHLLVTGTRANSAE